jgi:acyl-CoA-dependent ceramide synthase
MSEPLLTPLQLTYIGVAIFVTMDVSDVFLAVSPAAGSRTTRLTPPRQLAKCVNYVDETLSAPVFAFFVCVWT